jgi:ATP-dependent Clp protease adaptor protein ClpS
MCGEYQSYFNLPYPEMFEKRTMTIPSLTAIQTASTAPTVTPSRSNQVTRQLYPNYKIIVLNDDFNTFQHVAKCLMKYIPGMTSDRAWKLTNQIHNEGQAIAWIGPLEQAELYHMQLGQEGLTMAPLEKA